MTYRITDVQLIPVKPKDGLVAFASVVFNEAFYLGSLAVFARPQGGYRITYPRRTIGGTSLDVYYPINKQVAEAIEEAVIAKYKKILDKVAGDHAL